MFSETIISSNKRSSKYFAHPDCTSAAKKSNIPQIFWVLSAGDLRDHVFFALSFWKN
jgi:hypothetical protein